MTGSTASAAERYAPRVAAPPALRANAPTPGADGADWAPPAAVFSQQLCEVQLLLDFISGSPGRRLPDQTATGDAGLRPDWVEQVCRISWPPAGTAAAQADEEALLVKVKDYLNALASPANGASVAFTLLVAQEDNSPEADDAAGGSSASRMGQTGRTFSRSSLARTAFPGLVGKARSFRTGMLAIGIMLSLWLLLTCLLSWYVALGNARLGQVSAAESALIVARARLTSPAPPAAGAAPVSADAAAVPPVDAAACERSPAPGGTPLAGCGGIVRAQADVAAASTNVRAWLVVGRHQPDRAAMILDATSALSVLGSGVLPVFYGILGAGAAVLRLLARRMRLSLLMPRDLTLALQQLALGAVVGACIGLFVSPPGAADANLLGTVSLSSSALSFVAGFGVEAVFTTLEALIARLFNIAAPTATPPAADPKA